MSLTPLFFCLKSLGEEMDIYRHIPGRVRICAVMNEVYHGIAKHCGSEMECAVREAFYSALENYGCGERKEWLKGRDFG